MLARLRWMHPLAALVCAATALPAQAAPPVSDVPVEAGQVEESRSVLDRTCSVRIEASDPVAGRALTGKALAEITRVLHAYAVSGRNSEVYSINANADRDEVVVNDEVYQLLQRALDYCRLTGGAYDPTVASYDYLWNLDQKPFVRPLPEEIAARRAFSTCKNLVIKPNHTVRLMKPGMRISLTGIASGFALERAGQLLREAGVQNFRIRVGQGLYVQGRIGTRHWYATAPNTRHPGEALAQLYLSAHAVMTRSDSDRAVFKNARRYHEVLDPRVGAPASAAVQATVVAADPTAAEALAWAALVLGPKHGIELLEKQKSVDGFVVDPGGHLRATSGMVDLARLPPKMEIL